MNPRLFLNFLTDQAKVDRREFFDLAAKAGLATAIAALGVSATPSAAEQRPRHGRRGPFTDEIFNYADPANLPDWAPSGYGAQDQRGSFNEVTAQRTTRTLREVLEHRRPVKTYNLGELIFNGFPAFVTTPPRGYQQRMTVTGYTPPAGFVAGGGFITNLIGLGSNSLSIHEERFPAVPGAPAGLTYQIGTQLDNLNHIGAGPFFYNGLKGPDILTAAGTTKLGNEHMGPIVTRGILLDILGLKIARRDRDALGPNAPNGQRVLRSNYRITLQDIHEALEFGDIDSIEPGDAVCFRTGWNRLLQGRTPEGIARWNGAGGLPGPYVAEGRFLGSCRPALVASDTWALEVLGSPDNVPGTAFPVHQDLIMRFGVRIGESVVFDELAKDRVYEFVYIVTPQFVEGATCGSTPPVALAQPRH